MKTVQSCAQLSKRPYLKRIKAATSYLPAVHLLFLYLYNQKKSISLLFPPPSAQRSEASVVPMLKGQSFLFILYGPNLTNNSREFSTRSWTKTRNCWLFSPRSHDSVLKVESGARKDSGAATEHECSPRALHHSPEEKPNWIELYITKDSSSIRSLRPILESVSLISSSLS